MASAVVAVAPPARRPTVLLAVWSLSLLGAALCSGIEVVAWAAGAASVVVAGVNLLVWRRLSGPAFWLLLWLAVSIALAAVVGSFPAIAEVGEFLSGEGRALLAFLPLLPFLGSRVSIEAARRLLGFGLTAATILLSCTIVAAAVPATRPLVVGSDGLFTALASSHHIPGYVGGLCLVVALSAPRLGPRLRVSSAIVATLAVALSSSRTTVLGLVVALAYIAGRQLTLGRLLRIAGVAAVVIVAILAVDQRVRTTVTGILAGDRLDDAIVAFEHGSERVVSVDVTAADVNVLRRFEVWGEAFRQWWSSPVVGAGPFRLNDVDIQRSTPFPGALLVTAGGRVYSDFGAHNLVLQLAADGGLLLLLTFFGLGMALWRRGRRGASATGGATARALLVFAVGTSLTSNALLSPALVFPLSALLGPLLAVNEPG